MALIKEFFKEKKWMKWFQSIPKEWYKPTITVISLLFLFVVFNSKIIEFFNSSIIPILSSVNENVFSSVILLCILFIVSFFWWGKFKGGYYVRPIYILLGLFFSSIYWYYRHYYVIIPSKLFHIGFSDIVFCVFAIWSIIAIFINIIGKPFNTKKSKSNKAEEQDGSTPFVLEEDKPITCKDDDILGFNKEVETIYDRINARVESSSFSIGINARWGDGKSSLINLLVEKFKEDNDKFIVIRFNPRYSNNESIQSAFFELLFSKLKEYDSRFKSSFNDYLKVIDVIAEKKYFSAMLDTVHLFNREDEKNKINDAIKRLNKRIVVIIEDLDRLMKDEIIEVFKLIDGNAAFHNFIFISAYDKNHINSLLTPNRDKDGEPVPYSDKFFTMERSLPLRSSKLLLDFLISNLISNLSFKNEEIEEIKNTIIANSHYFTHYLKNLRDVKRYINLVKPSLIRIFKEVRIRDFLLIELVKYKYPEEHRKLYIHNSHKDSEANFHRIITIDGLEDQYKSRDILKVMFPLDGDSSFRSINSIGGFSTYFQEQIYDSISIELLSSIFDKGKNYKAIIDEILKNKGWNHLNEYLGSLNTLSMQNWEDVIRYIKIYSYLNSHYKETTFSTINVGVLIEKRVVTKLCKKFEITIDEYKSTLSKILTGIYPEYPFDIVKQQLWSYKSGNQVYELILYETELMDILKDSLKDLIKNSPGYTVLHNNILRACISFINPNTKKVTLDVEACKMVLETIKFRPDEYIDNFVFLAGMSSPPDWNEITCDPFWHQIFINADNIEQLIFNEQLNDISNIKRVRNFWSIYAMNNYEAIEFHNQGSVQAKIDTNLEDEHKQLQEILDIELNVNTVLISSENIDSKLDSLDTLLKKLESIDLYIKKRGDVITSINNKIEELNKLK